MDNFKQRFEIIYQKYFELGVSQGFKPSKLAFARFLGVLQGTMQNWEYKGSIPSGKDLKAIHDKLGFAYDWLISGEGEMFDDAKQRLAERDAEIASLKARLPHEDVAGKDAHSGIARAVGHE